MTNIAESGYRKSLRKILIYIKVIILVLCIAGSVYMLMSIKELSSSRKEVISEKYIKLADTVLEEYNSWYFNIHTLDYRLRDNLEIIAFIDIFGKITEKYPKDAVLPFSVQTLRPNTSEFNDKRLYIRRNTERDRYNSESMVMVINVEDEIVSVNRQIIQTGIFLMFFISLILLLTIEIRKDINNPVKKLLAAIENLDIEDQGEASTRTKSKDSFLLIYESFNDLSEKMKLNRK